MRHIYAKGSELCRHAALVLTVWGISLTAIAPIASAEPLRLPSGMSGFADLGTVQCDYFVELLPIGPKGFRQSLMTYAQGFVYAKSGQTLDQVLAAQDKDWSFESLSDEMVAYCVANPEKSVPDAAAHLWSALTP